MPATDAKTVATRCLEWWTTGDFETTRSLLADEVTFVGPLGETKGADAYVEGVQGFARMVEAAEPKTVFSEGEDVCIVYDLVTKTAAGRIPTAGWYRVRDGKVVSVRAFFDARPLVGS